MPLQLFALERYDTGGSVPVPLPVLPLAGVAQLISLVRLPDDDVLLAMVQGTDSETVAAAMTAAGWRVDRITPATWVCAPSACAPSAGAAMTSVPSTSAARSTSSPDPEVLP